MPWQDTARELLDQLRMAKDPMGPFQYPQGWALQTDFDTYAALSLLHDLLGQQVDPLVHTWCDLQNRPFLDQAPLKVRPQNPGRWQPHPPPPLNPVFQYGNPAIGFFAWQLANELIGVTIPPASTPPDPDERLAQDVLSFIRDAADCD